LHYRRHAAPQFEQPSWITEINILSTKHYRSSDRPNEQPKQPQERGLSRPILSEQRQNLTSAHRQFWDVEYCATIVVD
jgi:hypothetical protein